MGKKSKKHQEPEPTPEFKVNPFAGLKIKAPETAAPPPSPKPKPPPEPEPETGGLPRAFTRSAILVRLEKKGRGGKQVTVLSGFNLEFELEMQMLVGDLRRQMGTGGTLRGDTIELQGDLRLKAARFLAERGFRLKGEIGS